MHPCPYCGGPLQHQAERDGKKQWHVETIVNGIRSSTAVWAVMRPVPPPGGKTVADGFTCAARPFCPGLYPGPDGAKVREERMRMLGR